MRSGCPRGQQTGLPAQRRGVLLLPPTARSCLSQLAVPHCSQQAGVTAVPVTANSRPSTPPSPPHRTRFPPAPQSAASPDTSQSPPPSREHRPPRLHLPAAPTAPQDLHVPAAPARQHGPARRGGLAVGGPRSPPHSGPRRRRRPRRGESAGCVLGSAATKAGPVPASRSQSLRCRPLAAPPPSVPACRGSARPSPARRLPVGLGPPRLLFQGSPVAARGSPRPGAVT